MWKSARYQMEVAEAPPVILTDTKGALPKNNPLKVKQMLPELLQKAKLYHLLYLIDCEFSQTVKEQGCPFCNSALHQSDYPRKPRGLCKNIPEEYQKRHSLCCSKEDCRKRTLPPSCRFFGRKVYFWPVILIVMALRQKKENSYSAGRLMRLFTISRNTLKRWFLFFKEIFPLLPQWQRIRGLIPAHISNHDIPGSLLHFVRYRYGENELIALIHCLMILSSQGVSFAKIDGFITHAEDG